jgi:hypothetical protein
VTATFQDPPDRGLALISARPLEDRG